MRLQLPYEGAEPGSHTVHFKIDAPDIGKRVTEKAVFIVPPLGAERTPSDRSTPRPSESRAL